MLSVNIAIPTRNEEANISNLLSQIKPYKYGVIVIDDSDDATADIAVSLGARVVKGQRKGLGQAIIDGINASSADVVVVMDSDLSHNPQDIPRLLRPILEQGADFVIASRYIAGGDVSDWNLSRRIQSLIGVKLMQLVTRVSDSNSGFFACFPKGTKVVSLKKARWGGFGRKGITYKKTSRKIEDIKVGDKVLSYNNETSEKELDKVTQVFKRVDKQFVKLKFSNGNELRCTLGHPIAVISDGGIKWIPARQLKCGDKCLQYKYHGWTRRIARTSTRGKTWEEVYGFKKAKEMKEKFRENIRPSLLGNKRTLGYKHTIESRAKISEGHKGKKKPLETRHRMSLAQQKRSHEISEHFKRLWMSPNYAKRIIKSWGKRPTDIEKKLSYMLRHICPNEFRYNGDGRMKLDFDGIFPDFVNVNGKKKVIEVYAPYHKLIKYKSIEAYQKERKKRFAKLGYQVLFIEKDEFKYRDILRNKIGTFVHNPNVEIVEITDVKYEDEAECEVYNLETEKNHNYFAYGILVHNCRKDILDGVDLKPHSWKIMLEVLFKGNWVVKQEVPIKFGDRHGGVSKNSLKERLVHAVHVLRLLVWKFRRYIKFACVGGVGALWYFGILYFLTEYVHIWYGLSAVIGTLVAITNNYFINHYYTFRKERPHNTNLFKGWLKYIANSALGDGADWCMLILLTEVFGLWYMLSAFIASGLASVIKYTIAKKYIWGKKGRSANDADYEWLSFYKGLPWQKYSKQNIAKVVKELAGDAGVTVDIGSGSSPLGILTNHTEYIGIDVNEDKMAYMNNKHLVNAKFVKGNVLNLSLPNEYADTVLFIETIEHLESMYDVNKALDEIKRILKYNSKVIIAMPDFSSLAGRIMERLYGVFHPKAYADEHMVKMDVETLETLCGGKHLILEDSINLLKRDVVLSFRK